MEAAEKHSELDRCAVLLTRLILLAFQSLFLMMIKELAEIDSLSLPGVVPSYGSGPTSVFFENLLKRKQLNRLTSYIDASQVYGGSFDLATNLMNLTNDKTKSINYLFCK